MRIPYLSLLVLGNLAFGSSFIPETHKVLLNSPSSDESSQILVQEEIKEKANRLKLTSYQEAAKPSADTKAFRNEQKEPWFKGLFIYTYPAISLKPGTVRIETGLLYNEASKVYVDGEFWNFQDLKISKPRHLEYNVKVGAGLFKNVDIYFEQPVYMQSFNGKNASDFADAFIELGFQAIDKYSNSSRESLRFFIKQALPIGKYDNLSRDKTPVDASGVGLWSTEIGFSRQTIVPSFKNQFTRVLWGCSGVVIPASTTTQGLNIYLLPEPSGRVTLKSDLYSVIAIEQTLSKNWAIGAGMWHNWFKKLSY